MVVGLRMGLLALRELDSDGWYGLSVRAMLRPSPPDSCVLDGIQSSTGCTLGKGNITVEEGAGVSAEFLFRKEAIRVSLRPQVLEQIENVIGGHLMDGDHTESVEELAGRLVEMSDGELFEVEARHVSI